MAKLRIDKLNKTYGDAQILSDIDLGDRGRRIRRAGRPVGLRQVDAAAHDRRARRADRGRHLHRRPAGQRARARRAQDRHGVPILRALSAHGRAQEHDLRPEIHRRRARRRWIGASPRPRACCGSSRCSTATRATSPAASASASRSAARSCASPTCSCSTSRLSNLDAALRVSTRVEIAKLHRLLERDDRLRHARSDRSDDARRPHRRDEPGPHRAGRQAARSLL